MVRKTTSIKIDSELWKKVKKHCIDLGIDVSEYIENVVIENLIKKDLKKVKSDK